MELQLAKQTGVSHSDPFAEYRDEINKYYLVLRDLNSMPPVDVFRRLSAFSARVSEIRTRLQRVDTNKANGFRTKEIDPLLEEIDRQFKLHSRILTCLENEMKLSGERGLS